MTPKSLLILLAIVASVALLACSRSQRGRTIRAGVAGTPLIRTAREVYRANVTPTAVEFIVVATLTNRTRDTLFLHPCQQEPPFPLKVGLEKRVDGTWRPAWGRVCTHVLMEPLRFAPAQSRTDTVRVWGSLMPNEYPALPAGPVAGVYRLVYGWVYRSWDPDRRGHPGELLADSLRVSNEFRVVE
ncbi:MAG: hypothetical protein ABR499_05545 [Gemmatimonadaceae bacterium]